MSDGIMIGYARVSTIDQDTELQEEQLRAAGCKKVFFEQISGKTRDRPQLMAAMDFADAGDTFVITRLDRLSRAALDVLNIIDELGQKGVAFKALEQSELDTTNPNDPSTKIVLMAFAWVAEMETSLRRERQAEGIAKAKRDVADGKRDWGKRGPVYQIDVEDVLAKRESGVSLSAIARDLGVSRPTLYKRIKAYEEAPK